MPLWTLHHTAGSLSEPDRAELAGRITDLYSFLPRFYVSVVFHEAPAGSLYVGGEAAKDFVRIAVEHIARKLPTEQARTGWLTRAHAAVTPFMTERNLGWELHVDETPMELWSIQGLRPPPPDSDAERRWAQENRPTPY